MADFSSTVEITNNCYLYMQLEEPVPKPNWGSFKENPTREIGLGGTGRFKIADNWGPNGSEGTIRYRGYYLSQDGSVQSHRLEIMVDCPYRGDNRLHLYIWKVVQENGYERFQNLPPQEADAIFSRSYQARSNGGDWRINDLPTSGHPLEVKVTINSCISEGAKQFLGELIA